MCGIVYIKSNRNSSVAKQVIKRFKQQKNRGVDGFGFYVPETDKLVHSTKQRKILRQLLKHNPSEVLFHHRMPSSTKNTRNSCHPFTTKDYFNSEYVMVHNGTIDNDLELYNDHSKLGIEYISERDESGKFNDSEALMWDIALTLEGKQKKMKATGDIAFVMIKKNKNGKPDRIFWGRNSQRPLIIKKAKRFVAITSEGDGDVVETNRLYWFDYSSNRYGSKKFSIPYVMPIYKSVAVYPKESKTSSWYPYVDDDDDQIDYTYLNDEYENKLINKVLYSYEHPKESQLLTNYLEDTNYAYPEAIEWLKGDLVDSYEDIKTLKSQESKGSKIDDAVFKELIDNITVTESLCDLLSISHIKLFNKVFNFKKGVKS